MDAKGEIEVSTSRAGLEKEKLGLLKQTLLGSPWFSVSCALVNKCEQEN